MEKQYWLMKTEPEEFSFSDLKNRPNRTEPWSGVRNYLARNYLRQMRSGDQVLFYHSNGKCPGVAGRAEVSSPKAYPDETAFDPHSPYFDDKSTPERPRWFVVDVSWKGDLDRFVPLSEIREHPGLAEMKLVQKGQRLSVQPVTAMEFSLIIALGTKDGGQGK